MGRFGVGERRRGRSQRGRFEHGEHLVEDSLLELPAADALAACLGCHTAARRGRRHSGGSCPSAPE